MAQDTAQGFDEGTSVAVNGIAAGGTLNLRQGPGTTHPVLGTLNAAQAGLTVEYCDVSGQWCRVRSGDGVDGWAATEYLAVDNTPPAPPAMAKPGWHTQFPPDDTYAVSGVEQGSTLNVRAGPGTQHPVTTTLSAGRGGLSVRTCNDAVDWCQITAEGAPLGWVAARFLGNAAEVAERPTPARTAPRDARFSEAKRLTRITGITLDPGGTTIVPELPPYLLGTWDVSRTACAREDSDSRVGILENGIAIGAATARFKNALFRGDGYDLTTLLMQDEDMPNAVPQRALYRLEPDGSRTLALSGDVLTVRRLERCEGS